MQAHGAILGPAAKGNQQHRHGQQQQRERIKQDGEDSPAFHTVPIGHEIRHQASQIGSIFREFHFRALANYSFQRQIPYN